MMVFVKTLSKNIFMFCLRSTIKTEVDKINTCQHKAIRCSVRVIHILLNSRNGTSQKYINPLFQVNVMCRPVQEKVVVCSNVQL